MEPGAPRVVAPSGATVRLSVGDGPRLLALASLENAVALTDGLRTADGAELVLTQVDDPGPARGRFSGAQTVRGASPTGSWEVRYDASPEGLRVRCEAAAERPAASWIERDLHSLVPVGRGPYRCGSSSDGAAWCWRAIACWDTPRRRSVGAVRVGGVRDAVGVAVGPGRACAWSATGALTCWDLPQGQPGEEPPPLTPTANLRVDAVPQRTLARVSLASDLLCRLFDGGEARCEWPLSAPPIARTVRMVDHVRDLRVRGDSFPFVHALLDGGRVVGFGPHAAGAGRGDLLGRELPARVAGLDDVADVVAGEWHACVRRRDGGVLCWGRNDRGECGGTRPEELRVPRRVTGVPPVKALRALGESTCAIAADGGLWCWGQVADGAPRRMSAGPVSDVEMNDRGVCAIGNASVVRCWESPAHEFRVRGPMVVRRLHRAWDHTCALDGPGRLWCWPTPRRGRPLEAGYHYAARVRWPVPAEEILEAERNTSSVLLRMPGGAVGEVYLERDRETWLDLPGFSDVRQIVGSPPCTLGRDDVLACGTHSGTETLAGVARAARGEGFTCAVLGDATVACWGRNDFGQLAAGGPTSDEPRPVVRLDPDDQYRDASYDPPPRGGL